MSKAIPQEAVWAEVSLAALAANYARLCAAAGDAGVMAVVKGNGYGHGAVECARALVQAGAEWLGVTNAAEGLFIREAVGADGRIFVMRGSLPDEAETVIEHNLTPVVWTLEQMEALESAAVKLHAKSFAVHVEIDSGMSRQGVSLEKLPELLARFAKSSTLRLEGVMTHFAAAEDVASEQNAAQLKIFKEALELVHCAGLQPAWIHAGNTSAVDAGVALPALLRVAQQMGARLMGRTGIGLYGYALPLTGAQSQVRDELEPVLAWKTRVLAVSEIAAGTRVGYSGTFTAERPMRLALLPVGYADGLRRELSNSADVLIAGKRARVVGRVSMDVTTVDVTEIAGVQPGDEVVILGAQGGECITADDHARVAGTIAYEILCGISARVPRLYA